MNYSTDDHIRLKRVASMAVAPDGSWLAVAVERLDREGAKYVSDIWKVPASGSAPTQLTRGDSRDTAPGFRSDGTLAFLSNRPSNEIEVDADAEKRMQVWLLPRDGGEPRQLTDEPLGVEQFQFARSADRLALFAPVIPGVAHPMQRETWSERLKHGPSARLYRAQPVRHWDRWLHENPDLPNPHLIAYSGEGRDRMDLTPGAGLELAIEPVLDVSTDGEMIAVTWQKPGADRELDTAILLIAPTDNTQTVVGAGTNVDNQQPRLSPDGKTLVRVRTVRSPKAVMRPTLVLLDLASGRERTLAEDWDRWPHLECWGLDGGSLVATSDERGDTPVFSIDVRTGRVTRVTSEASGGVHSDIHMLPDGRLAGIRSTLVEAPECFVVDPRTDGQPVTLARLSGLDPVDWARVERCQVASTDGGPVQFFVVKPKQADGVLPALIWIHGGPIGMSADGWHWRWNPLLAVARGYAVVLPNPRGSTGFGQDFIQGIWGNVWGGQCYEDLMSVADAIEERSDVDGSRIMAMGGSFGGYMTNWIGTQTDRFRCLVTHAGIFTLAQFTGVTDHPAWWYIEMGGEDPYADPVRFNRYAPAAHVRNWRTPTLIIHGELDYRCPIGEGLNLFEALQYHGVESELCVFPDENHWILKPRNVAAWYRVVFEFLDRHMATERE